MYSWQSVHLCYNKISCMEPIDVESCISVYFSVYWQLWKRPSCLLVSLFTLQKVTSVLDMHSQSCNIRLFCSSPRHSSFNRLPITTTCSYFNTYPAVWETWFATLFYCCRISHNCSTIWSCHGTRLWTTCTILHGCCQHWHDTMHRVNSAIW